MIPRGEGLSTAGGELAAKSMLDEYQRYEASQAAANVALRAALGPVPQEQQEHAIRNAEPESNPYSIKVEEKYYDETGEWQERAECSKTDPEVFFPEKGGSTREAKKVCLACPVRQDCLDHAISHDERFGIWGGMSERERRRLKKRSI